MTRATTHSNKVAILATGDEVVNGDIINSNSQIIAQHLFSNSINVGMHMAVSDNISAIKQAIDFLLTNHKALIMTGGLGPTSDDLTRFALSEVLKRPLVFDEATWESICSRFKTLGYTDVPESNRQQALFPKDAKIIHNANGTAAGCMISDPLIFMLPGPPSECLVMVEQNVLPTLIKNHFQESRFYDHWYVFGMSESVVAEQLDAIAKPYQCETGYRLTYPYIEVKLQSPRQKDFDIVSSKFKEAIKPHIVGDGKIIASQLLEQSLPELNYCLTIRDVATGGLLENTLKTPRTIKNLDFSSHVDPIIQINGLQDFWLGKKNQYNRH